MATKMIKEWLCKKAGIPNNSAITKDDPPWISAKKFPDVSWYNSKPENLPPGSSFEPEILLQVEVVSSFDLEKTVRKASTWSNRPAQIM